MTQKLGYNFAQKKYMFIYMDHNVIESTAASLYHTGFGWGSASQG